MTAYIILTLTSVISGFALAKDWPAHKTPWRRVGVLLLIIALWAFGIANLRETKTKNESDKLILTGKIDNLNGVITAGQKQAKESAEAFSGTISHLSDRVADLQAKVQNSELQEELTQVRGELVNTQKAMAPPPKAVLHLNFVDETSGILDEPKSVSSRPIEDGHMLLRFNVSNATKADADDGYFIFQLCDACSFTHEPPGWERVKGTPANRRNFNFQRYLARSTSETFEFEVAPPVGASKINVLFAYRCKTCEITNGDIGTIMVATDLMDSYVKRGIGSKNSGKITSPDLPKQ